MISFFFFFNDTAPPEIYPLSLHDALPIFHGTPLPRTVYLLGNSLGVYCFLSFFLVRSQPISPSQYDKKQYTPSELDRKSTRLNSSHTVISYAAFCLQKPTIQPHTRTLRGA